MCLFVVAEDRIRDIDNWLARLKPGLDALCLAKIIVSDSSKCLEFGKITFEIDPARAPMTVIEVKKSEENLGGGGALDGFTN